MNKANQLMINDAERYRWLVEKGYIRLGPVIGASNDKSRYIVRSFIECPPVPVGVEDINDAIDYLRKKK